MTHIILDGAAIRDRDGLHALLSERLALPEAGLELLEAVGRKRGCLVKGGVVDLEKAVNIVLTEFRSGKLGAVTLDAVPAEELAGENEGSEKIID